MLNCSYCFYNTDCLERAACSDSQLPEVVNDIANSDIRDLVITGGDPLHPEVFDETIWAINKFRTAGKRVSICSSLAVSQNSIEDLINSRPDMIFASCDSHIREIHDRQRGKWKLTLSSIKKLLTADIPLTINCTVTKLNRCQIREIFKFFTGLGVTDVDFNLAYLPKKSPYYHSLSCENLACREVWSLIDDLLWCAGQNPQSEKKVAYIEYQARLFTGIPFKNGLNPVCQMGKKFLVIDRVGKIKPCFHLDDVWGNLHDLRSITDVCEKGNYLHGDCAGRRCSSLFAIDSFWKRGQ